MPTRRPFWKWHRWKSIGFYPSTLVLLNFGIGIKAKLKLQFGNQKMQYGCQAPILKVTSLIINRLLPCHKQHAHEIWNWKSKANSRNHAAYRKRKRKIQYGHLAAILKMSSMKINRLLPIYTSIVLLNFGVDIQSQTTGRAWKAKNPKWPPGGHFGSDVSENK